MNNKEYIAELAQQTGYSQEDTQKLVRKAIDAMIAEFEDGEAVSIPNFGTFEVKERKARIGRNPQTGEPIQIRAGRRVGFRVGKALKESV